MSAFLFVRYLLNDIGVPGMCSVAIKSYSNIKMKKPLKALLICLSCFLSAGSAVASLTPKHLVFTYMGDPSTTLTVNWQLIGEGADVSEAIVYYDTVSHGGDVSKYAQHSNGKAFSIDGLKGRLVARVQLTELKPNTSYYIVAGHPDTGFADEVKVRTIPDDDSFIRFVTGGDMGTSEEVRILLKNAATYDPRFAAVGGDVAYANGKLGSVDNWDTWLTYYTEEMVTADGHTIPLFLAIGNHEVNGGFKKTLKDAPFYFGFFGQNPTKSYFDRQFGKNLLLLALDSGHVTSHESQVQWMHDVLKGSKSVAHRSAIYHVPLYPSHRDFMGHFSDQGRQYWAPVFDAHGLTVAFENHDHTFKRSHFIKDGAVVEEGVGTLYLGDGCWGRDTRSIAVDQPWYLKVSGSIQHFWVVDCDANKMVYRAVDLENRVFDVYPESTTGAKEARAVFAAKSQLYELPHDIVKSTGIIDDGSAWKGSDVTVSVVNTFEFPISLQLKALAQGAKAQATGLPTGSLRLLPNESEVFAVSWTPLDGKAISLKKARLRLSVSLELQHPDHDKPLRFTGSAGISIKNP